MTREEETKEAYKYYMNNGGMFQSNPLFYFKAGTEWADEHPKNEWISVEDSLPEQDEEVIVLCDELNVAPNYKISFGHIVDKTICQDYNGWNIPNVVYWIPMPKVPKEQEIKI